MEDAAGSIVSPDVATLRRIGIALGLSAAMHLAFVIGVRVAPPRHPQQPSTIEARLRPVEAAVDPAVVEPLPADNAAPEPPSPAETSQPAAANPDRDIPGAPPRPSERPLEPTPPITRTPPAAVPAETAAAPTTPPAPESFGPALEVPQIEDPEFYPARKLDVLPHPLAEVPLRYPEDAAKRDVSGRVVLLLLIDELGMVVEANVISAEPAGVFEDAALESFRHVQFSPAQRNGRVVKSRLPVEVTFDPKIESLKR